MRNDMATLMQLQEGRGDLGVERVLQQICTRLPSAEAGSKVCICLSVLWCEQKGSFLRLFACMHACLCCFQTQMSPARHSLSRRGEKKLFLIFSFALLTELGSVTEQRARLNTLCTSQVWIPDTVLHKHAAICEGSTSWRHRVPMVLS